ncbi:metallophosphoesterase [Halalkalicoccus subterraneus]|uniref:metallophosphoesterase n=1 Tax=Halalkalicoccus subterraneus TaxID=2675002 RepID=UPI000EFB791C|nr:metallophosphoesterase [Halalkalicoccus subterraneus]
MFEECVFRDRALYVPDERTLVLADVHLGRDRASNVQLPLGERRDLLERLDALLARFEPREVVVAGDLLHSFDRLPRAVERSLREVERRVDTAGARLVVTRGNHDTMLKSVFDPVAEYAVGDLVVCHGHERPPSGGDAAGYVIGHVHPAITIEGRKRPCYLRGPADGGAVLVLPAFTRLAGGVDVARVRSFRSPLLGDPNVYRPVVRDEASDETLPFPPLGEFRTLL